MVNSDSVEVIVLIVASALFRPAGDIQSHTSTGNPN